jgi:hypothetical protein
VRRVAVTLTTLAGEVVLEIPYGQDRETGEWHSPVRTAWGLESHQHVTPELQQRLCLTAAATFSYERAAEVAACWRGHLADDSTIHRHVQRAGARAVDGEKRRERALDIPAQREELIAQGRRAGSPRSFSMVIMMDGWMSRDRGKDWGMKPAETKGDRVSWREVKTGIVFRVEDRAKTAGGRPIVIEKSVVAHQGEWGGLAPKLYAEALRCGLKQAREVFVVSDGGVWIWNLAAERFGTATGVLDFYHASQHLWSVANTLHGENTPEARAWVEPLLHQLSNGGEAGVLTTIDGLADLAGDLDQAKREILRRETGYFNGHREHLHYKAAAERGCPKGSGAMESTCAQLQGRFKRTGQFWTEPGKQHLLALELARRNGDWRSVWDRAVVEN